MDFETFRKLSIEHYDKIVEAITSAASKYDNVVFSKNKSEYTYLFEQNTHNHFTFKIIANTFHQDLPGKIKLTIDYIYLLKWISIEYANTYSFTTGEQNTKRHMYKIEIENAYEKFENAFWKELTENLKKYTFFN